MSVYVVAGNMGNSHIRMDNYLIKQTLISYQYYIKQTCFQ